MIEKTPRSDEFGVFLGSGTNNSMLYYDFFYLETVADSEDLVLVFEFAFTDALEAPLSDISDEISCATASVSTMVTLAVPYVPNVILSVPSVFMPSTENLIAPFSESASVHVLPSASRVIRPEYSFTSSPVSPFAFANASIPKLSATGSFASDKS